MTKRHMTEVKLKRKADTQARLLLGVSSADIWPTAPTPGLQVAGAQPGPSAAPPPQEQKRKAEAMPREPFDPRPKISRQG